VALARLVVAILENYQQADGSVELPPAIVPYMDNISKLTPPPAEGVSSSPSGT
jgi:seryl-tRNA synthetase